MKVSLIGSALVVAGSVAAAQSSSKDAAAWSGIMSSPVGAFPQIETTAGGRTDGSKQLAIRVSSWKFANASERANSIGATYLAPATSRVRYSATLGWTEPTGDDGGTFLVGGDAASALWESAANTGSSFSIDWKLSLGLGHMSGNPGGTVWSAVGQLPLKWKYHTAGKSDLSAFVSPGYGLAGTTDVGSTEAETGTRPIVGFGGAWTSAGGVGLHVGAQLVPLDLGPSGGKSPWVGGLAVSFPIGG